MWDEWSTPLDKIDLGRLSVSHWGETCVPRLPHAQTRHPLYEENRGHFDGRSSCVMELWPSRQGQASISSFDGVIQGAPRTSQRALEEVLTYCKERPEELAASGTSRSAVKSCAFAPWCCRLSCGHLWRWNGTGNWITQCFGKRCSFAFFHCWSLRGTLAFSKASKDSLVMALEPLLLAMLKTPKLQQLKAASSTLACCSVSSLDFSSLWEVVLPPYMHQNHTFSNIVFPGNPINFWEWFHTIIIMIVFLFVVIGLSFIILWQDFIDPMTMRMSPYLKNLRHLCCTLHNGYG